MSPSIGTIFECTGRDEVLGLLDVFLNDFAESWFAYHIPLELRPSHIRSVGQLENWRMEVQRQDAEGKMNNATLLFLKGVLDAASRRIQSFSNP